MVVWSLAVKKPTAVSALQLRPRASMSHVDWRPTATDPSLPMSSTMKLFRCCKTLQFRPMRCVNGAPLLQGPTDLVAASPSVLFSGGEVWFASLCQGHRPPWV